MVARLADLVAGSPPDVRFLCVTSPDLMSATAAFREGIRRVNHAPAVLAGMFAVTLLVSLPRAYALETMIAAHLGSSLAAESLATGTNYDWWQEFSAQASGLGTTFVPSISGFAAVLN